MSRLFEIAPGRYAHAAGALWLASSQTALITDTHLGFGWAQRRRGELGPVHDNRSEPKLRCLIEELRPRRLVVLGDFVHAPRPAAAERTAIEETIAALRESADLILVRGNHDRGFARDFGLPTVDEWAEEDLLARHGDRVPDQPPPDKHLILGHLHPVLNFRDRAGAKHRLRVFLTNSRATILPAFSPFAAGYEINQGLPANLQPVFAEHPIQAIPITGNRVGRALSLRL